MSNAGLWAWVLKTSEKLRPPEYRGEEAAGTGLAAKEPGGSGGSSISETTVCSSLA